MASATRYYSALRASMGSGYQATDTELQDLDHSRILRPASEVYGSQSNFTTACSDEEENEPLRKRDSQSWQTQASHKMGSSPHRSKPQAMLELLAKVPYLKRLQNLRSWRVGVAVSATLTIAVLFTNLLLALWASIHFGISTGQGIGTAYEGDCDTVKTQSLWLHILINGLSSALLSASNYTMQCASAPTREECDKAHVLGDWLDIGVVSTRNLTRIGWRRRIVWVTLALSSFPVHLFYNSTVFITLDANEYNLVVASAELFDSAHPPVMLENSTECAICSSVVETLLDNYFANMSAFETLDIKACIDTYGKTFVSGHRDVVLVTKQTKNVTVFSALAPPLSVPGAPGVPYSWMCDMIEDKLVCDLEKLRNGAKILEVAGQEVDHCVAQSVRQSCKLQFSLTIMAVVIVCNLLKCLSMLAMLWRQRETTFVVWGDAMSSWLDSPSRSTEGRCLISGAALKTENIYCVDPQPMLHYGSLTHRVHHGISRRRWSVTFWFCTGALGVVAALLRWAFFWMGDTDATLTSPAFGTADSRTTMSLGLWSDSLVGAVVVANSPQVILSATYLLYNGLFTGMHLVREYSGYESQRKGLRVTTPNGAQRSTYWLQLPYTYSIPLIIASAILHWLVSQSIFLVRVTYNRDGQEKNQESGSYDRSYPQENVDGFTSVGFNAAGILSVLVVGSCVLLVGLGMSLRKISSSMPIAASCSFALAAAAHRPAADSDASIRPVKWGEVPEMGNEEVGHCCFTSQEVVEPQDGRLYAGADTTTLRRRM